jgi:hypothetical protein
MVLLGRRGIALLLAGAQLTTAIELDINDAGMTTLWT